MSLLKAGDGLIPRKVWGVQAGFNTVDFRTYDQKFNFGSVFKASRKELQMTQVIEYLQLNTLRPG